MVHTRTLFHLTEGKTKMSKARTKTGQEDQAPTALGFFSSALFQQNHLISEHCRASEWPSKNQEVTDLSSGGFSERPRAGWASVGWASGCRLFPRLSLLFPERVLLPDTGWKQIAGIIFVLQRYEPRILLGAVGGLDAFAALVGFPSQIVHVHAAGQIGLHGRPKVPTPADGLFGVGRVGAYPC